MHAIHSVNFYMTASKLVVTVAKHCPRLIHQDRV